MAKVQKEKKAKKPKVKMFKNKKWMWITIVLLIGVTIFTYIWLNTYAPLPEQFDAVAVEEDAKRAIEYFNERDYQSIIDMGTGIMDEAITVEDFASQGDTIVDELGEFVEYTDVKLVGATNKSTGEEFGGAIIKAEYENGSAKFTIAFNEEMTLAQFVVQ